MPLTIDQQLASADNFAILASSTVTNSGNTVITGGNLGLYPGTSITGFPPGVVTPPAVTHQTDQIANQAEVDAMSAYNFFQAQPGATPIVGNLNTKVLTPGIYSSATSMDLSVGGTLTLSGNGNFIFQIGSTLTINVGATVLLTNGALAKNVFWAVGSSATIGTSAVMVGDVVALASVSLGTGASLNGRAIGLTGAVTLLGNAITMPASVAPPPFPVTTSSNPATVGLGNLSEICFPDITGKVIRSWGLVTITPGGYTVGGIPFGLFPFLDVRTVDVNAFLKCDVYGEEPLNASTAGIKYHYSPVNDSLQIFYLGVEFAANQTIPAVILSDLLLFEAWVDRTSVRG